MCEKSEEEEVITKVYSALTPAPRAPEKVPTTTKAPLIYHITTKKLSNETTLQDLLIRHTALKKEVIQDLTKLGSVYLHHTPNARKSAKARRVKISQLAEILPEKVYVRVHAHPKRYTCGYEPIIIGNCGELVIVHKPYGIPCCAGVDNCLECVTYIVGLVVTTRLDICTSGLLVMGKDSFGARLGNEVLKDGIKIYVAVCEGCVEDDILCGVWKDWYKKGISLGRGRKEKILRRWEEGHVEGYVEAKLEIMEWFRIGERIIVVVKLITGRTHQIRLQMCGRGLLVVGDDKYVGLLGNVYDVGIVGADCVKVLLHCWKLFIGRWFTADISVRQDFVDAFGDGGMQWLLGVGDRIENRFKYL